VDTRQFKRDAYKVLDAKAAKEGIKSTIRKARGANLVHSVMGVREAAGRLMVDFNPFILGFQLNDQMRLRARDAVGDLLLHAVNVAKLTKGKVPPAQRKIKPKSTATMLLTEIDRVSAELLSTLFLVQTPEKVEEVAKKVKVKLPDGSAAEKMVKSSKVVPPALDVAKLANLATHLLSSVYEFTWAVYQRPAVEFMAAKVEQMVPKYPKGFFALPPKKVTSNLPKKGAVTEGEAKSA
jgi:hypothetical protein